MIKQSTRQDKKFQVTFNGSTIHFGAKGYRIKPSTKAGDSYCARSYGITDKQGNPTRNNPNSANYWSRKKWNCRGRKSI